MISANRIGAATGLVGAVLQIAGTFVAGSPPAPDTATSSIVTITSTAALLSVLAPIVVIARTGILRKWLVVLGAIEIAVNIVEIAGFFSRSGWNAGGYAAGIGPMAWVVWLGAVSSTMFIRTPAQVARTISVSAGSA